MLEIGNYKNIVFGMTFEVKQILKTVVRIINSDGEKKSISRRTIEQGIRKGYLVKES